MDLLQQLVSCWNGIVDKLLDETELTILRAYIRGGSISLYRISEITRIALSTTYKKAKKLINLGLIRQDGVHTFRVTVKGLIQCLAQQCDNPAYIVNKIRIAWGLNVKFEEVCSYLIVLAQGLKRLGISLSRLHNVEKFNETIEYIILPILFQCPSCLIKRCSLSDALISYLGVDKEVARLSEQIILKYIKTYVLNLLRNMILIGGFGEVLLVVSNGVEISLLDLCRGEFIGGINGYGKGEETVDELKELVQRLRVLCREEL